MGLFHFRANNVRTNAREGEIGDWEARLAVLQVRTCFYLVHTFLVYTNILAFLCTPVKPQQCSKVLQSLWSPKRVHRRCIGKCQVNALRYWFLFYSEDIVINKEIYKLMEVGVRNSFSRAKRFFHGHWGRPRSVLYEVLLNTENRFTPSSLVLGWNTRVRHWQSLCKNEWEARKGF